MPTPTLPKRSAIRLWAGLAVLLAAAACNARTLTVCVSLNPVPPLTYPDKDGSAQLLLRQALARQGDQVNFVAVPWLRCRLGLKAGSYQAALPMVASPDYVVDYAFPLRNGSVDTSRALGLLTVGVVRRVGSAVEWNGSAFQRLATPVMVLPGQMAARDRLKALGVAEDTESPQADLLLRKLLAERRDAAVLPTGIAQAAIATEEFRGKLELLPQPLAVEPAYLAVNREFMQAEPAFVDALWTEMARLGAAAATRKASSPR